VVWPGFARRVSALSALGRPHPERREPGGPASRAAYKVSTCHQLEDCQGDQIDVPRVNSLARGRGRRMSPLEAVMFLTPDHTVAEYRPDKAPARPCLPVFGTGRSRRTSVPLGLRRTLTGPPSALPQLGCAVRESDALPRDHPEPVRSRSGESSTPRLRHSSRSLLAKCPRSGRLSGSDGPTAAHATSTTRHGPKCPAAADASGLRPATSQG